MRFSRSSGFETSRRFAWAVVAVATLTAVAAAGTAGPSFDCRKAQSQVLKTVCASPKLSALDAELANVYQNTLGQPRIDHVALERDEAQWMRGTVNRCTDTRCIGQAYEARLALLRDISLQAASPAAYAETRPFPAPPALMAEARSYVGKPCDGVWSNPQAFMPGSVEPKGFPRMAAPGGMVFVREKQGVRFAFFANVAPHICTVLDVVVLPSPARADAYLHCAYGTPADMSSGIGMRKAGVKKLVGYWEIDSARGALVRQPLGVLGVESSVRCQAPEMGD